MIIQTLILVFGLICNTMGAFLLYHFGVEPLRVTQSGEGAITFINSPSPEEREKNKRLYLSHLRYSKGGLLLLVIGFLFQLAGVLWPYICKI